MTNTSHKNTDFNPQAPSILSKGNIVSIQSHVAYGHAGNSAAVFPMQRLGYNVSSVNTVLFSNHTGYGKWQGDIVSLDTVKKVIDGLEDRGVFAHTQALITGYMGSDALGDIIKETNAKIKAANPDALYICDTVFGDVGRGIFATEAIASYFKDTALGFCDIATPNLFEAEWMSGIKITDIKSALQAGKILLEKGLKAILITSLEVPEVKDDEIAILAMTHTGAWVIKTPKVSLPIAPNGSGDATTAIFCAHYLDAKNHIHTQYNQSPNTGNPNSMLNSTHDDNTPITDDYAVITALEHTASSIYAIFLETERCQTRELQIIASGDSIKNPATHFKAQSIIL